MSETNVVAEKGPNGGTIRKEYQGDKMVSFSIYDRDGKPTLTQERKSDGTVVSKQYTRDENGKVATRIEAKYPDGSKLDSLLDHRGNVARVEFTDEKGKATTTYHHLEDGEILENISKENFDKHRTQIANVLLETVDGKTVEGEEFVANPYKPTTTEEEIAYGRAKLAKMREGMKEMEDAGKNPSPPQIPPLSNTEVNKQSLKETLANHSVQKAEKPAQQKNGDFNKIMAQKFKEKLELA